MVHNFLNSEITMTNSAELDQSIEAKFNFALEQYKLQNSAECELLLKEILALKPHHFSSLSLMCTVLHGQRAGEAQLLPYVMTLAELQPENSGLQNNLGSIYWATNDFQNARDCFENAIRFQPNFIDAWVNLGTTLLSLDEFLDAESALNYALTLDSNQPDVESKLANCYFRRGKVEQAIQHIEKSMQAEPSNPKWHANHAIYSSSLERFDDAQVSAERACELAPMNADYHANLAKIFIESGEGDKALSSCRKALSLDPDCHPAYISLGTLYFNEKELDTALSMFESAARILPEDVLTDSKLATTYMELDRFQDAIEKLEIICEKKPFWRTAWYQLGMCQYSLDKLSGESIAAFTHAIGDNTYFDNLANAYCGRALSLQHQGNWKLAEADFSESIRLQSNFANAHFGRSMIRLKMGNYVEGFSEYNWRFEATESDVGLNLGWEGKYWQGQDLRGKTLLIEHEQGLGDAIQFARYLPLIKKLGGKIIFRCGPPLFRLIEQLDSVDLMLSRRESDNRTGLEYDYVVHLISLSNVFGTTIDTIPAKQGYLHADPLLGKTWRDRLGAKNGLRVGLVWSGNPDQGDNANRSVTLEQYSVLADINNVEFFALQVGSASEQIAQTAFGSQVVDYSSELHDFAETAALISNLDLVITVDTSVAHLCGALGLPVWTLVWFNGCWRYHTEETVSSWYNSMHLYRQTRLRHWDDVLFNIKNDLVSLSENVDTRV